MTEHKRRRTHNWLQILQDWEASGKSIKDFCIDADLHATDFYRMKKKLSQSEQSLVKIENNFSHQLNSQGSIILETPSKYRIIIEDQFNSDTLKSLLTVIGSFPCS